ncbi:hypothetical protein [Mycobacterium bourgelatii]|uniref:Lipoprotein LpqS n=1 Tax=Mycobacterium bourgelatii TaxID=1273442 RepID=A0A7I9YHP8_MYCBU|nr:hypothetical protein [Mycobacterium bourgelatii]MCV6978318.1 hypothetical protein [Mycobacterium bourgelatii]GFG88200.1 hypothetical protein MBOU_02420 [Mycobacterium bourgelatii]
MLPAPPRTAVAAIVATWLVLGMAGLHCGIPQLAFGLGDQSKAVVLTVDHDQAGDGASACPAKFATAISPRATIALAALGLVAVVGVIVAWAAFVVRPGGRSPPAESVLSVSGRDLLTRFCLARQ